MAGGPQRPDRLSLWTRPPGSVWNRRMLGDGCSGSGSITSEPRFQEKQHFGSGVGTEAAWLDRIGNPEVPRPGDHEGARDELCLLKCRQEGRRLRVRIDDVVMRAIDQKKPRRAPPHPPPPHPPPPP